MKKLYDEIMAFKIKEPFSVYGDAYNDGLNAAAELAKKYDDEIERLKKEIETLEDYYRYN